MAEDWRFTLEGAEGAAGAEAEVRARAPEGVDVRRDDDTVVVYADTRADLEAAVPTRLLAMGRVERWHPEHGWKDPGRWDEPGPTSKAPASTNPEVESAVAGAAFELLFRLLR